MTKAKVMVKATKVKADVLLKVFKVMVKGLNVVVKVIDSLRDFEATPHIFFAWQDFNGLAFSFNIFKMLLSIAFCSSKCPLPKFYMQITIRKFLYFQITSFLLPKF